MSKEPEKTKANPARFAFEFSGIVATTGACNGCYGNSKCYIVRAHPASTQSGYEGGVYA